MLLTASAFSALGLLLGLLAGLTSAPVTVALIGALFAFVGGSAATYFGKLTAENLRLATLALLCLSLAMTLGVFGGIVIRINRLLEFRAPAAMAAAGPGRPTSEESLSYLRSASAPREQDLAERVGSGTMTLGEACNRASAFLPGRSARSGRQ